MIRGVSPRFYFELGGEEMKELRIVFLVLNKAIEFIKKKDLAEDFIDFLPNGLKGKVRKVMA